jgi:predicted ferric reductase
VIALGALFGTSAIRRRLRLAYSRWRAAHVVLGVGALLLAVAHAWGVHRYLAAGPGCIALGVLTIGASCAVIHLRVARPRRLAAQPYVVDRVEPERGGATTVHLRADGHAGRLFEPGQFAWIKPGEAPLAFAEHPFSYSSSAEVPERPSFTIKSYAGFSARAATLKPGSPILVDGPHGAFRLDPRGAGALLVAGGIGITPCISVLRTACDRGDPRPYVLVYGSRTLEEATFREELWRLGTALELAVVHVLSRPEADWRGERGRVDRALLERHLPDDLRGWDFLVCGPPLMADGVLGALVGLGLPAERVHVERFVAV